MKYEEDNFSNNQKKTGTGLIIAIAVAILIIAAAAWFALSRYNGSNTLDDIVSDTESSLSSIYDDMKSDMSSMTSDIMSDYDSFVSDVKSEYNGITSSYNDIMSDNMSSARPTGDNISSVPYTKAFSMPVEGDVVKDFSDKELIYSKTFGDMRLHSGIDILCKKGTSVSACGDGKVISVDESGQFGTVVSIEHSDGITAKYASLSELKVKAGDSVKAGDILGVTATIPAELGDKDHLHLEIYKNGIAVEPLEALGF